MIDLDEYEPTGETNTRILELGLGHIKSVQGHRLLNHLQKLDPSWFKDYIISGDQLITPNLLHRLEFQTLTKPQFLVAQGDRLELHETVMTTKISLKSEQILNYFINETGFQRIQKKEKVRRRGPTGKTLRKSDQNEESPKASSRLITKAFEQLSKEEKSRKKRNKQRIAFLKRRKANMEKRKAVEEGKPASE